jgi:hypothetical protein
MNFLRNGLLNFASPMGSVHFQNGMIESSKIAPTELTIESDYPQIKEAAKGDSILNCRNSRRMHMRFNSCVTGVIVSEWDHPPLKQPYRDGLTMRMLTIIDSLLDCPSCDVLSTFLFQRDC